jgi:hypothetical protein
VVQEKVEKGGSSSDLLSMMQIQKNDPYDKYM